MTSQAGPSGFSQYASRYLKSRAQPTTASIFHSPDDPFLPSPDNSNPHLPGSSRSTSPISTGTPPHPGPGIDNLPDMEDEEGDGIGFGLLFESGIQQPPPPPPQPREVIPNPYAVSDSDEEMELDLEDVDTVRRSLVRAPVSERAKKGWLAHQSVFPPSSSESESSESDKVTEGDSDSGQRREEDEEVNTMEEPLLDPSAGAMSKPARLHVYHGRFGHWEGEGLRKYKDSGYLALWLTSVLLVFALLLFVWGSTHRPDAKTTRPPPSIIPLLPILFVLVIPALVFPVVFIYLLRKTVRPVLIADALFIPSMLFICGWWSFAESFEAVDGVDSWWNTTGLRLGALGLWIAAAGFARLMWTRRKGLDRAAKVVELATQLLLSHPPLLLLIPLLLGVFTLISIPYLTLLIRLGTIGYWRHPHENTYIFHIRPHAGWLIALVTLGWIWTWGVLRGISRVTVAGVIGEWYFHRDDPSHLPPMEVTTAALHRATGTSLGSICLGAGIVAIVRLLGRTASALRRLTKSTLPSPLSFLSTLTPLLTIIASLLDQLNGYALIYIGITGDPFWPSARRAVNLSGRRNAGRLLDYTFIKLLLTLSSVTLSSFTGMAGWLYMAHSMRMPEDAVWAGMLCGGVPFLVARAGMGILGDAWVGLGECRWVEADVVWFGSGRADTLFVCYQIDRELGNKHSDEAEEAFVGEKRESEV